jgi:septum formation protein
MPNPQPALILASGSPRRRQLLAALGLPFTVVTSGVPEDVAPGIDPVEAVLQLAQRKAEAVAVTLDRGLVIGSDTDVVLDDTILGKPADAADAARMLRLLRGRTHRVISGVAVLDTASGRIALGTVTTLVTMVDASDAQIAAYAASGEPLDKAGAYAIQGLGGALVAGIDGCYNNVVGFRCARWPPCSASSVSARSWRIPSVRPPRRHRLPADKKHWARIPRMKHG